MTTTSANGGARRITIFFGRLVRTLRLRPRPRKLSTRQSVIAFFVIFMLLYAAITARTIWKVRLFRRHPSAAKAEKLLAGNLPHDVMARYLMFRKGSQDYRNDLLNWAYGVYPVSDTYFNRLILEQDLLAHGLPEDGGDHYPISTTDRLLTLITKNLEKKTTESTLHFLFRCPSSKCASVANKWIQVYLSGPEVARDLIIAGPALVNSATVSAPAIFAQQLPRLKGIRVSQLAGTSGGDEDVFGPAALSVPTGSSTSSPEWAGMTDSNDSPSTESDTPDPYVTDVLFHRIASTLRPTSMPARPICRWVVDTLVKNPDFASYALGEMVGACLNGALNQDEVLSALGPSPNVSLAGGIIDTITLDDSRFLHLLFLQTQYTEIFVAESALMGLVEKQKMNEAFTLAKPILDAHDSSLKKDLIVILLNHNFYPASGYLDSAFMGLSQRHVKFDSKDDYAPSHAVSDYQELAGRSYFGTAKQWPPLSPSGRAQADEPQAWQDYIRKYPWSPGTDDAYYHLCYWYLSHNQPNEAFSSVIDYFSVTRPDTDAEPWIRLVLNKLLKESDQITNPELSRLASDLNTVIDHPLLEYLITDSDSSQFLESLRSLESSEAAARILGVSTSQMQKLVSVIPRLAGASVTERIAMSSSFINGSDELMKLYFIPNLGGYPSDMDNSTSTAPTSRTRDAEGKSYGSANAEAAQRLLRLYSKVQVSPSDQDSIDKLLARLKELHAGAFSSPPFDEVLTRMAALCKKCAEPEDK